MIGLSPTDPLDERDGAEYLETIEFPGGLMTTGLSSFAPLEERDAPEYLELTELYNRILQGYVVVCSTSFDSHLSKLHSLYLGKVLDNEAVVSLLRLIVSILSPKLTAVSNSFSKCHTFFKKKQEKVAIGESILVFYDHARRASASARLCVRVRICMSAQ